MMYDVLVIGAGVAGLAAARILGRADRKVKVLEARSRVGGRIFTNHTEILSIPVELGAEFIHGESPETLKVLSESADVVSYEVTDRHHGVGRAGLKLIRDPWSDMLEVLDGLPDQSKKDKSFDDFMKSFRGGSAFQRNLAKSFVEGFEAAESSKISAKALAPLKKELRGSGKKMARLLCGYDQVSNILLGDGKNISLNTVVRALTWKKDFVEVQCVSKSRGPLRLQSKKVLMTVPLGVLKALPGAPGAIQFNPPLEKKVAALSHLEMGHVTKIVLVFDRNFWSKEENRQSLSFVHLKPSDPFQAFWTASPLKVPMLTAWAGGTPSFRFSSLSKREISEVVLRTLHERFRVGAPFLKNHLRALFFHNWTEDPFSRGAYSYPGVGGLSAKKILAVPESKTIYFAGEALADGDFGTVNGAISSGVRAARDILRG